MCGAGALARDGIVQFCSARCLFGMSPLRFIWIIALCAVPSHWAFSQKTNRPVSPVYVVPEITQKHLIKYVAPQVPGHLMLNGSTEVKLEAVIGKDGRLLSAKIVEGHVMLYAAALDSVRAVEIQTISY